MGRGRPPVPLSSRLRVQDFLVESAVGFFDFLVLVLCLTVLCLTGVFCADFTLDAAGVAGCADVVVGIAGVAGFAAVAAFVRAFTV